MKKLLVTLMAAIMVMATMVPAFAEDKYQDVQNPDTLVDVTGDNTRATFKKYFITKDGSRVPTVEFKYTIEPVSNGIPANPGTSFEVLKPGDSNAGGKPNATGTPTMKSGDDGIAKFDSNSTTYNTKQSDDNVHLDANEQYSKDTVTIDFSSVTFYEPGVYRYIVKETKPATPDLSGIIYDTQEVDTVGTIPDASGKSIPQEGSKERTLDVYVTEDGSGNLVISQYVLHEGDAAPSAKDRYGTEHGTDDVNTDGAELADKSDGFVNEYKTVDLDIMKVVTGNQGSRDKYFKFKLVVSSPTLTDNDLYVISVANDNNTRTNDGDCDAEPQGNAATIYTSMKNYEIETSGVYYVKGSTLNSGFEFYLQHNQHIVFRDLPADAQYTVTEEEEDYTKKEAAAAAIEHYQNATSGKLSDKDVISDDDGTNTVDADGIVKTGFKNTRSGIIPTGLIMSIGGGALIVILAATCLIFLNRRKESEDEI